MNIQAWGRVNSDFEKRGNRAQLMKGGEDVVGHVPDTLAFSSHEAVAILLLREHCQSVLTTQ